MTKVAVTSPSTWVTLAMEPLVWMVFDEHVLDGAGLGMGQDRRGEDGGEAGEDDQKSSAHAALLSGRAGGLPWLGRQDGLETDPLMAASR